MAVASYDFATLSRRVEETLHAAFPGSAVSTSEGWHGRIHAKIVSPAFDGMDERSRQATVWEALTAEMGEDSQAVSLVLVFGIDEI